MSLGKHNVEKERPTKGAYQIRPTRAKLKSNSKEGFILKTKAKAAYIYIEYPERLMIAQLLEVEN